MEFFRGMKYALPIALGMWAILIGIVYLLNASLARYTHPPVKPEPQIQTKTTETALVSRGGFIDRQPAEVEYVVTAYTAGIESTGKSPGDPAYGITASGTHATVGRTCACPPELTFGTHIYIEGLGERVCEDTGGNIQGNRLDVYMDSVQAALNWGRQTVKVRVER